MQEGVFVTPQEAMEPIVNEMLICDEFEAFTQRTQIKLSFPQQQLVEEHEHVV